MSAPKRSPSPRPVVASLLVFFVLAPCVAALTRDEPVVVEALSASGAGLLSLAVGAAVWWSQRRA
ncbi:hypothetical protein ACFQZZ_13010 [Nocardia sp. GCM10030253]|uniref:hypothetical protein n=1 Tax=Nocardia sp. GCM10030253 TaxID=3273404 RepID=UPI0036421439